MCVKAARYTQDANAVVEVKGVASKQNIILFEFRADDKFDKYIAYSLPTSLTLFMFLLMMM